MRRRAGVLAALLDLLVRPDVMTGDLDILSKRSLRPTD